MRWRRERLRNMSAADPVSASASAVEQIARELVCYACDEMGGHGHSVAVGTDPEDGTGTEPTLLAVAMEHQQNRAEVTASTLP